MKKKLLLALWVASALLLLCACQQASAVAQQLDGYMEILEQVGPIPTVTPTPSATPKPSYVPKVTPSPTPTVRPSPSLYPMPTLTPAPSVSPSPTPSASPSPSPSPTPTPTPVPTVSYAPMPESIPFIIATPTPEPTPEPTTEPTAAPAVVTETPVELTTEPVVEPVAEPTAEPTATPYTPSPTYSAGLEVAQFALQYVGYNYLYGGESPEEGFDCSGLVYYVYQQFGYTISRVASSQAYDGEHVEHDAIEPGDVLCFYTSGSYVGHSGIYIGGGEYVHAQGSEWGVVISPLSERGESYEARRIL